MTADPKSPRHNAPWAALVPFFAANVLFGAGLWVHAFLYNFYLEALDHDEAVMGLAAAALTAGGLTALAPAGVLADRVGARAAYLGAVVLAGLGLFAGALVERESTVYAAAFLAGAGAAGWRVAMAPTLMAIAEGDARTRAFSWNVALLVGSGALWTALSGRGVSWLGDGSGEATLAGLRGTLAAGALLTLVAGPLFLAVTRGATAASGVASRAPAVEEATAGPREALGLTPRLALLVVFVLFWMTAGGLVLPFFNLYFQRTHGLTVEGIGTLFAAVQLVTAAALFGAAELARAAGPRRAFGAWAIAAAPALWALAVAGPLPAAVVLYLVAGLVPPATNPLIDQMLLERADRRRHGVVSSWRNGATEASGMIGAAAGGFLLEAAGFGAIFVAAGVVAALGGALLVAGLRPRPAPAEASKP